MEVGGTGRSRAIQPKAEDASQVELEEAPQPQPERVVRCRECGHQLTLERLAFAQGGSHEHTFRNPAGYSFHVRCFTRADGCLQLGTPIREACWFSGYAWCLACCEQCQTHVGWWYVPTCEAEPFAGLIATRLA